ncbi:MAG TPA: type II toxin-antitoxin system HicA family toxin [Aestuariivirgaceae bacterium]|nr:type II toxin-antitoxin system HicA family toxin [Aestuariivirgaceae bacterium]
MCVCQMTHMKAGELIRLLRQAEWIQVRQRGSHRTYKHPDSQHLVTVPMHGSRDLSRGVLRSIERITGLILR